MWKSRDHVGSLITAARVGSREALGELFEAYRPFLEKRASQYLDRALLVKLGDEAIVQETFATALRCFPTFRGCTEPQIAAWLVRILEHRAHDFNKHFRTRKRDVAREVPLTPIIAARLEAREPKRDPPSHTLNDARASAMRRALVRLPTGYRRVLRLHGNEERGFEEVAKVMQKSVGAIRKMWERALRLWREEAHTTYQRRA
jgi:RNA polymerase sigma-70 factor (ECF subfamily)